MHLSHAMILAVVLVSATFSSHVSAAAEPATAPASPRLSWKTPDGVGLLVQADDPILTPPAASPALPPVVKPEASLVQAIAQAADGLLKELSEKTTDKDTQYYEDGVWHYNNADKGAWIYQAGPAGAAAALWNYRQAHLGELDAPTRQRQDWLRQVSIETFDRALKDHQLPDGDFSDCTGHRIFFTIDFVSAYLTFKDTMEPEMRQRWLSAMKLQVDHMIQTGDLPNPALPGWKGISGWYVNGNVEIGEAAWLYLVSQATGDAKYKNLYELQLKHTLRPSLDRWHGYGLYYLKEGVAADGADGAAFLTEANNLPGFDGEYGMLQLSTAARLYARTRDPRVLRLTNLLMNSLLPHVDTQKMLLNATYGSRHSVITSFSSCAPEIMAWLGGRGDLAPMLVEQFHKGIKPPLFAGAKNGGNPGAYRAYGYDMAALLEAATVAEAAK